MRGRFHNSLALSPESATVAREIYYRQYFLVDDYCRENFSGILVFFLMGCERDLFRRFQKDGPRTLSRGDSILVFKRGIKR